MNDERIAAIGERRNLSSLAVRRNPLVLFILAAMEAVLLVLVCLSPWAYGAVPPSFQFLLAAGIALLLALWAVRMVVERQITWKNSVVAICLGSLFLLGIWQATPLSQSMLAWFSPGIVRCYDQLLPKQPEVLPNDVASSEAVDRPGSTLSLYPGWTQRESIRLLAVFLVFVVVYNNLTSKESLIRLSWIALLNGSLLSLFALIQFFAAPPYTVYWIYSSLTTPFGPFICHNHFPDYVNMCIGLGIGLLLSQDRRDSLASSSGHNASLSQLLRNPRALWICSAMGLMLTAVAFSRSRGGVMALMGAAVLCGVLGRLRFGRSFQLGPALIVAGVVLGLSSWFGMNLVITRLSTIGTGEAFENRVPLWLRSLRIVPDFPIWGTGYGTFGFIETMYRPDEPSPVYLQDFLYDHAHNDYLEILVEGGAVGLGLVVIALVAVYRRGFRALIVNRGSRRAGLALGTLFAFTAVALHSLGEFGAHIPAIMLLATVVCAHLCALGQTRPRLARSGNRTNDLSLVPTPDSVGHEDDTDDDTYRIRLGGIAPIIGAVLVLSFGILICADTWKAHRIDRLRDAAFRAGESEADQLRKRIACLSEAVSLGPEDAQLGYELGFAHELLYMKFRDDLLRSRKPLDPHLLNEQASALQEYLRARNACPLLFDAQWGIAAFALRLKQGDAPEIYLRRAKLLSPGQAQKWYLCGMREITLGLRSEALASWRHCLELSDQYLAQVLSQTSSLKLSTKVLEEQVLPDNPDLLLQAALRLYPDFGSLESRRPFLEKALRLLDASEDGGGPQALLVKARIYRALDQADQAIRCYRALFSQDASDLTLRFEFASYLHKMHKWEEAQRELTGILAREPQDASAKELLDRVLQEMLREKDLERKRQKQDWWLRHGQR